MYEPGCGLSNVTMTYGHDEYMYNVLVGNGCPIPEEGLYMIRFHSFYPWHKEQEYKWREDEKTPRCSLEFWSSTSLTCTPSPTTCPTLRLSARTTIPSSTNTALESSVGRHSAESNTPLTTLHMVVAGRNSFSRPLKWVSSWQKDLKVVFILHTQILTEDVLCESASTESVVDMDGDRRRPGEIEQVVEIGASLPAESAPSLDSSRHQCSKPCQLLWMMSRPSSVVVEESTTRVLNLNGWLRKVSCSSRQVF